MTKARDYDNARDILKSLVEKYPDHPWIQTAQAEPDLADNKADDTIARYVALINSNPDKIYLNYNLANAYLTDDQPGLAKKLIRYQIRRHRDQYPLYQLLSRANAELGFLAEAHQADAEFHSVLGNYRGAIESLKLALRESGTEGYLAQSISRYSC